MYNVQRCSKNTFNALYDITGFASWDGAAYLLLLLLYLFKVGLDSARMGCNRCIRLAHELVIHERQAPPKRMADELTLP